MCVGLYKVYLNRQSVGNTIQRYLETGNLIDRERKGRPKLLHKEHYLTIDNLMDENNKLTGRGLKEPIVK